MNGGGRAGEIGNRVRLKIERTGGVGVREEDRAKDGAGEIQSVDMRGILQTLRYEKKP